MPEQLVGPDEVCSYWSMPAGKHARAQKLLAGADAADKAAAEHRVACNTAAFLASNVGDQPAFKVVPQIA